MSRSILHDWEVALDRCCKENLPLEMEDIAKDIYNTAYERGKNHSSSVLSDKIGRLIQELETDCLGLDECDTSDNSMLYAYKRVIEELNNLQSSSENYVVINTEGLDEGIRCAMCTNHMRSSRGCDGGCAVDDKMYNAVMDVVDSHINMRSE